MTAARVPGSSAEIASSICWVVRSTVTFFSRNTLAATASNPAAAAASKTIRRMFLGTLQDGRFWSVAPTDPLVTHLDELQMELKEGPCLQAAVSDAAIRCSDLQHNERFPTFSGAAQAAGVRGVLSFQL
jgi:hypothetical protein